MEGAIDPYKEWDENNQNPFTVPLASGIATLSSEFVVQKYPDLWREFEEWAHQKKISEPPGSKSERIVLLYSGETEQFKERVAQHIATKYKFFVLTAPHIYEKETGNKIAFAPFPKEGLNAFIKRMICSSQFAVILYTEQGGQIIETSWCSDFNMKTLGLVHFYRGRAQPDGNENPCPFLHRSDKLFWCSCKTNQEYKGKVGAYICSDAKLFCPFTQQKITKMVFDFYIMNETLNLFGAWERPVLLQSIESLFL